MSVTAVPLQPVKSRYLVWLWIGIALAIVLAVALAFHGTGRAVAATGSNEQFLAWHASQPGVQTTASGLQYQVIEAGEGPSPTDTDVALVEYAGQLRDGTQFDASQQPTPMPVTGVVPGFSEGLKLMRKGAKYRFWMPADLAYGDRSPNPAVIPNGSLLIFDVTLVDFLPQAVLQQMQMQQMMQQGMPGAGPGGAVPGAGQPEAGAGGAE